MKSVAVCCSKKYAEEVAEFCEKLRAQNILVFEPNFKEPLQEDVLVGSAHITKVVFKGLTLEHFDWVRKAETCYILNLDDYVGVSVTMEMAYASALGKPIFAYSAETGDPCRNALIDQVITKPEELAKLLS